MGSEQPNIPEPRQFEATINSESKETLILKIKKDASFSQLSDVTVTVDENAESRAVKTDSAPLELPAGKHRLVIKGKCP